MIQTMDSNSNGTSSNGTIEYNKKAIDNWRQKTNTER